MSKSREELIADYQNDLIELMSLYIEVDGYEEVIEFSQDMEDFPQELHIMLPEKCTYHLTVKYRAKSKPLEKLTYYQAIKKGSFPVHTRKEHMADIAHVNDEENPHYTVKLPPDTIPGGMFVRGTHPAVTKIYSGKDEIFATDWTISVVKASEKPKLVT